MNKSALLLIHVLLTAIIFKIDSLHAAEFMVDSTIDALDTNVGDGICLSTNGQCTLRAAIQEANALVGSDVIKLNVGQVDLSLVGHDDDLNLSGDLDVLEGLHIIGVSSGKTTIDGHFIDRVLDLSHAPDNTFVYLSNLNITRGHCQISITAERCGSGFLTTGAGVRLENVDVSNHKGHGSTAVGFHVQGACVTGSKVKVSHNNGTSSSAISVYGHGSCLVIDEFEVTHNHLDVAIATQDAMLQLSNGLVAFNDFTGISVGGGSATLTNMTVSSNAHLGILNDDGGRFTLLNSTVTANGTGMSSVGGILDVHGATNGNGGHHGNHFMILRNSIVAGNFGSIWRDIVSATGLGGNIIGDAAIYDGFGDQIDVNISLGSLDNVGGFAFAHKPDLNFIELGINCVELDVRGVMRPQDGNNDGFTSCDSGAVEHVFNEVVFKDGFE